MESESKTLSLEEHGGGAFWLGVFVLVVGAWCFYKGYDLNTSIILITTFVIQLIVLYIIIVFLVNPDISLERKVFFVISLFVAYHLIRFIVDFIVIQMVD